MSYADLTVDDPNPLKRWIHGRRFSDAVRVLRETRGAGLTRVLDFGTGDGEFLRRIGYDLRIQLAGYEPTAALLEEAKRKLARLPDVVLVDKLEHLKPEAFDYVFCMEVFEHLPEKETADAIEAIWWHLAPQGLAVVGVPHELFIPALLKGVFRMFRRYGAFDAGFRNIVAATSGRAPSERPVSELAPGVNYHPHHLGFDFRLLERRMLKRFNLVRRWFSPVPPLGAFLNVEVYYLLRKIPDKP